MPRNSGHVATLHLSEKGTENISPVMLGNYPTTTFFLENVKKRTALVSSAAIIFSFYPSGLNTTEAGPGLAESTRRQLADKTQIVFE